MCGDAGGDSGSDYGDGGAYSDHKKQREEKLAAMSVSEREAFLAKEAKLHKKM